MLLTLLKPETRLAFAEACAPFPLDDIAPSFIGAGISLIRSGAIDFGQRPMTSRGDESPQVQELYFADFLNNCIVDDLFDSVRTYLTTDSAHIRTDLTLGTRAALEDFAQAFAQDDCWAGAFAQVDTFDELQAEIRSRIQIYRDYLAYNVDEIPDQVSRTKSSAGEPISVAAELLRTCGVIGDHVEVFIRIDEYETLARTSQWLREAHGERADYTSVVHKMLGLRDPRVSYRIATRRHAWPQRPRMQGTSGVLEELRNFQLIDLDDLTRRRPYREGLFDELVEDIFTRRLRWAGYPVDAGESNIKGVFGSLSRVEESRLYLGRATYRVGPQISADNAATIRSIAQENPLAASLGEAWILRRPNQPVSRDDRGLFPWERAEASRWRASRSSHALMRLAQRHHQRLLWAGHDRIVGVSGGNPLAFVSVCQSIWDAWIRQGADVRNHESLPNITNRYVQDEGVRQASSYWFRKLRADPDGDRRLRFVAILGEVFRSWLGADAKLAYPGYNAFSLDFKQLTADPDLSSFLREAAAYGVLIDRRYRDRARGKRLMVRWQLASIYCPYFQLPIEQNRDARRVSIGDVRSWLHAADMPADRQSPASYFGSEDDQTSLFDAPS